VALGGHERRPGCPAVAERVEVEELLELVAEGGHFALLALGFGLALGCLVDETNPGKYVGIDV